MNRAGSLLPGWQTGSCSEPGQPRPAHHVPDGHRFAVIPSTSTGSTRSTTAGATPAATRCPARAPSDSGSGCAPRYRRPLRGREFAILLEHLAAPAHLTANRIVTARQQPIDVDGVLTTVTASVGLPPAQPGDSAATCCATPAWPYTPRRPAANPATPPRRTDEQRSHPRRSVPPRASGSHQLLATVSCWSSPCWPAKHLASPCSLAAGQIGQLSKRRCPCVKTAQRRLPCTTWLVSATAPPEHTGGSTNMHDVASMGTTSTRQLAAAVDVPNRPQLRDVRTERCKATRDPDSVGEAGGRLRCGRPEP